jgi:hypothetical protein
LAPLFWSGSVKYGFVKVSTRIRTADQQMWVSGPFGPNQTKLRNVLGALSYKASVPYSQIADSSYNYFAQDKTLLELDEFCWRSSNLYIVLYVFTFEQGTFCAL